MVWYSVDLWRQYYHFFTANGAQWYCACNGKVTQRLELWADSGNVNQSFRLPTTEPMHFSFFSLCWFLFNPPNYRGFVTSKTSPKSSKDAKAEPRPTSMYLCRRLEVPRSTSEYFKILQSTSTYPEVPAFEHDELNALEFKINQDDFGFIHIKNRDLHK